MQAEYAPYLPWDHVSFASGGVPSVAGVPARVRGSAVNIHRFAELNVAPELARPEADNYIANRDAMRKFITEVPEATAEQWRACIATEADPTWDAAHKIYMVNSRGVKRFLGDVPRSGGMNAGIKAAGPKDDVFAARESGVEPALSFTVAQVKKVVDMKETVRSGGKVGGARGEGNAAQNSILRGAMTVITPASRILGVNRGTEYSVLMDRDGAPCGIAVASADGVTAAAAPAPALAREQIYLWESKWSCDGTLAEAKKDAAGGETGEVEYAAPGCLHGAKYAADSMDGAPGLWASLPHEAKAHYRPVGELLGTIRQIMMCSHVYGERRDVRGVFVVRACLKEKRALNAGEEPELRDCYWYWQYFSDDVLSAGREKLMYNVTAKLLYFEPCLVAGWVAFMGHGDPAPAARHAYEKLRAEAGGVQLVERDADEPVLTKKRVMTTLALLPGAAAGVAAAAAAAAAGDGAVVGAAAAAVVAAGGASGRKRRRSSAGGGDPVDASAGDAAAAGAAAAGGGGGGGGGDVAAPNALVVHERLWHVRNYVRARDVEGAPLSMLISDVQFAVAGKVLTMTSLARSDLTFEFGTHGQALTARTSLVAAAAESAARCAVGGDMGGAEPDGGGITASAGKPVPPAVPVVADDGGGAGVADVSYDDASVETGALSDDGDSDGDVDSAAGDDSDGEVDDDGADGGSIDSREDRAAVEEVTAENVDELLRAAYELPAVRDAFFLGQPTFVPSAEQVSFRSCKSKDVELVLLFVEHEGAALGDLPDRLLQELATAMINNSPGWRNGVYDREYLIERLTQEYAKAAAKGEPVTASVAYIDSKRGCAAAPCTCIRRE